MRERENFDTGMRELEPRRKKSRWARKTKWLAAGVILAIAGGALAYTYLSNVQTGTTVVSGFPITLTGGPLPSLGFLETPSVVTFTATSNTGGNIPLGVLELNFTKPGIALSNLTITTSQGISGTPSCSGSTCTWLGGPFTVQTTGTTIIVTLTFHATGSYATRVTVKA